MSLKDPILSNSQMSTTLTNCPDSTNKPQVQRTSLKCICLGNVDSGKSSFIGVITTGLKDNSKGSARSLIAQHPHEVLTGKTSTASHHLFGYTSTGAHVAYNPFSTSHNQTGSKSHDKHEKDRVKVNKNIAWNHIVLNSARTVSIIDLAGHMKYLKTSIANAISSLPDLAFVLVSPHTGLSLMTIEHISLCIALKLRIVILVTKIDRIDKTNIDLLKRLKGELHDFVTNQCHRTPLTIKTTEEIDYTLGYNPHGKQCVQSNLVKVPQNDKSPTNNTNTADYDIQSIVPIFYISSTTLQHYDLLHYYLACVQPVTWNTNHSPFSQQVVDVTDETEINAVANNTVESCEPAGKVAQNTQTGNNTINTNDQTEKTKMAKVSSSNTINVMESTLSHGNTTVHRSTSDSYNKGGSVADGNPEFIANSECGNTFDPALSTSLSTTSMASPSQNAATETSKITSTTVSTTANTAPTAPQNSFAPMRSRDITIPHDLVNLISFEMRVDEKFTKANVGLILSGTVTFGEIESNKRAYLGPFCSNRSTTTVNSKTNTTITSQATSISKDNKKGSKGTDSLNAANERVLDVEFIPVQVKSVQLYRSQIETASLGDSVGISVKYDAVAHKNMQKLGKYKSKLVFTSKDLPKEMIFRGMVLLGLDETVPFALHRTIALPNAPSTTPTPTPTPTTAIAPSSTTTTTTTNTKTANTTATTTKATPNPTHPMTTIKAGGFPYEHVVASYVDLQIDALHPQSYFRAGSQIMLHCSALSIPIVIEKVLVILDPNTNQIIQTAENMQAAQNTTLTNTAGTSATTTTTATKSTTSSSSKSNFIISPTHGIIMNTDREKELTLRYQQRGIVRARFIHQQYAYIHVNEQILLRDGSTRAFGVVKNTYYSNPAQ